MDGKELFSRLISTVQETAMKIGDSSGSISLYYPFQGDFSTLEDEFRSASADFPDMIIEDLPERVRVIVSEGDCNRISKLPMKGTIKDMVGLVKERLPFEDFRKNITSKYPDAKITKSAYQEFDWVLTFPKELDDDVYCLTEEFGQITYHRYSEEEYLSFGFVLP